MVANLVAQRRAQGKYWGLKMLAQWLNGDHQPEGDEAAAWRAAAQVVRCVTDPPHKASRTLLTRGIHPAEAAATAFNAMARNVTVRLVVRNLGRRRGKPCLQNGIEAAAAAFPVFALWREFFTAEGLTRIKRCPQCERFFADVTKNHKAERCSERCTNRWWSVARRRAKGHASRQRAKAKRTRKHPPAGRRATA